MITGAFYQYLNDHKVPCGLHFFYSQELEETCGYHDGISVTMSILYGIILRKVIKEKYHLYEEELEGGFKAERSSLNICIQKAYANVRVKKL